MVFLNGRKEQMKTPFRIARKDGSAFAMAGIWDKWTNPEGEEIRSFAILTTAPNSLMEKFTTGCRSFSTGNGKEMD